MEKGGPRTEGGESVTLAVLSGVEKETPECTLRIGRLVQLRTRVSSRLPSADLKEHGLMKTDNLPLEGTSPPARGKRQLRFLLA